MRPSSRRLMSHRSRTPQKKTHQRQIPSRRISRFAQLRIKASSTSKRPHFPITTSQRPIITPSEQEEFIQQPSFDVLAPFRPELSSSVLTPDLPNRPLRIVFLAGGDISIPLYEKLLSLTKSSDESSPPLIEYIDILTSPPANRLIRRKKQVVPSPLARHYGAIFGTDPSIESKTIPSSTTTDESHSSSSHTSHLTWFSADPTVPFSAHQFHREYDLGIVFSFPKLIPPHLIEACSAGMINLHPSLLPLYRGASPLQASLVNNDSLAGLSIMKIMPRRMDVGQLIMQYAFPMHFHHDNNTAETSTTTIPTTITTSSPVTTTPTTISTNTTTQTNSHVLSANVDLPTLTKKIQHLSNTMVLECLQHWNTTAQRAVPQSIIHKRISPQVAEKSLSTAARNDPLSCLLPEHRYISDTEHHLDSWPPAETSPMPSNWFQTRQIAPKFDSIPPVQWPDWTAEATFALFRAMEGFRSIQSHFVPKMKLQMDLIFQPTETDGGNSVSVSPDGDDHNELLTNPQPAHRVIFSSQHSRIVPLCELQTRYQDSSIIHQLLPGACLYDTKSQEIVIACAQQTFLGISHLKMATGVISPAHDVVNGYFMKHPQHAGISVGRLTPHATKPVSS